MAQVEQHLPIDHHHHSNPLNRTQDPSHHHPALSSVPTAPGPELDPNYSNRQDLPQPPRFSPPHSLLEPLIDSPTLAPEIDSSIHPSADLDPLAQLEPTHSLATDQDKAGVQGYSAPDPTPVEAHPSDSQLDHPPPASSTAETLEPTSKSPLLAEVAPIAEQLATETPDPAPYPSIEPPQVASEPAVESVGTKDSTPVKESLQQSTVMADAQSVEPTKEREAATLIKAEADTKPTVSTIEPPSIEDWTDLTKPAVQFALCLFAIPWSSLIITSRTVNQLWYLVFKWPIIEPVAGIMTSIVGPSVLYGSLIALLVCWAAEI